MESLPFFIAKNAESIGNGHDVGGALVPRRSGQHGFYPIPEEPFVDQVPRRSFVFGRAGNPKFNFFHIVKYEVFNQGIDVNFKKVEKIAGAGRKEKTQRLARSISMWVLLHRQDKGVCAVTNVIVQTQLFSVVQIPPSSQGKEKGHPGKRTR